MLVRVRHFAILRERRGKGEETVEVEGDLTVGRLYDQLFPASSLGALPVMYAVNQQYVTKDYVLKAGDEVAFIPPLGGG